jgi:SagB-type dehydrogenase family enzyme
LPPENWTTISDISLISAFKKRKSHRVFKKLPLTLEELSFLLWATQGIRQMVNAGTALRTVPSAGARHSFETYLIALQVDNLEPGMYRYSAVEHQLILERIVPELRHRIVDASYGQSFVGKAPVSLVWTTIPYRMEWRYHTAAHKVIAIDVGHVCQNLYLAVEAIGAGTCAIAAYHQELMDDLLGVDGEDEFAVYMAAVGKL